MHALSMRNVFRFRFPLFPESNCSCCSCKPHCTALSTAIYQIASPTLEILLVLALPCPWCFSASCCPKLSLAEKSDPQGLGLAAGIAAAVAPALTVSLPFCPEVLTQRTIWEEVLGDEHFLWIWQRPCGCKTLQVICKVSLSRHLNHLQSGKLLLVVHPLLILPCISKY